MAPVSFMTRSCILWSGALLVVICGCSSSNQQIESPEFLLQRLQDRYVNEESLDVRLEVQTMTREGNSKWGRQTVRFSLRVRAKSASLIRVDTSLPELPNQAMRVVCNGDKLLIVPPAHIDEATIRHAPKNLAKNLRLLLVRSGFGALESTGMPTGSDAIPRIEALSYGKDVVLHGKRVRVVMYTAILGDDNAFEHTLWVSEDPLSIVQRAVKKEGRVIVLEKYGVTSVNSTIDNSVFDIGKR